MRARYPRVFAVAQVTLFLLLCFSLSLSMPPLCALPVRSLPSVSLLAYTARLLLPLC